MEKHTFLRKLGVQIEKIRRSKGYSQDRLILEAGFSRGTISKIESGSVDPQIWTLAKIARTIGVPLARLISIESDQKR